jgi:hypothetical protein
MRFDRSNQRLGAVVICVLGFCGWAHAASDLTIKHRLVGSWTESKNSPEPSARADLSKRYYLVEHFEPDGRGDAILYAGARCGSVVRTSTFTWAVKQGKLLTYHEDGSYLQDNVLRIQRRFLKLYSVDYSYAEYRKKVTPCRGSTAA